MASESFWWCYRCQARVDSAHVTFSEHHDGCGGGCEVLDDEPDVFAAARAWQAFRDWCDGTYDMWMEAVDKSLEHEYEHGWDDAERFTEWKLKSWQWLNDFLNGSVEQWQARVVEVKRTKVIRRDAPEIIIDEGSL